MQNSKRWIEKNWCFFFSVTGKSYWSVYSLCAAYYSHKAIIKSHNFAVSRNGNLGSLKFSSWFFSPIPSYCLCNMLARSLTCLPESSALNYLIPYFCYPFHAPTHVNVSHLYLYISVTSFNQLLLLSFVSQFYWINQRYFALKLHPF